jgi:predicted CopG family antitoxin
MPLKKGKGDKVVSENIRELWHAKKKRSKKQIIAIAMRVAGRSKKK